MPNGVENRLANGVLAVLSGLGGVFGLIAVSCQAGAVLRGSAPVAAGEVHLRGIDAELMEGSADAVRGGGAPAPSADRAAAAQEPAAETAPSQRPVCRALLVGCSEYPYLRQALGESYESQLALHGPAHDVELVQQTLACVLGLAREHTTLLAGWSDAPEQRPSRANILGAFEHLARDARQDDTVVLYLAGHGSQQRVQREKRAEEPDGLEEIFLAADARKADKELGYVPGSIRDDELGAAVRKIRDTGASVWLIVDSCHAGTMLRGAAPIAAKDVRLRGIDAELLGVEGEALRGGSAPLQRVAGSSGAGWLDGADTAHIAALYGSTSYGRAPEMDLPHGAPDAVSHGLFTYLLCQELVRTGAQVSYRELAERVVAAYQAFPCALTVPTAEGDLERPLAGGAALAPALVCTLRGGAPVLNQGRLAGFEPGVTAELFELAQGAETAVGRVEVVESDLFEARARLVSGTLTKEGGPWRARTGARPLGDYRLAVALIHPDGSAATREELSAGLRDALAAEHERFPLVAAAEADWCLVLGAQGRLWLRPGPREGGFDVFGVDAGNCLQRLSNIQKVRNLQRFAGSGFTARFAGDLDVWIEHQVGHDWQRLANGTVLRPGETIRARLQKTNEALYDVNVFYLDANFGVQQLYPAPGSSPRLAANAREVTELMSGTITDDALGLEHLLVFATPRTEASKEIDLGPIVQRGLLRGGASTAADPFAELLQNVLGGGDLRGGALHAEEARGTEGRLTTLQTAWAALVPPPWPTAVVALERGDEDQSAQESGLPDPWSSGSRAALAASSKGRGPLDLLMLGDAEVGAVLFDLDGAAPAGTDPAALVRARSFDAELAVVFGPRRYAYYDRENRGSFDLVLLDPDGDGIADERWALESGRWLHDTGVALPWLSQGYLSFPLDHPEVARRLAVLQR